MAWIFYCTKCKRNYVSKRPTARGICPACKRATHDHAAYMREYRKRKKKVV